MGNRDLDRAIDQLGAYFGIRGRDTFLRAIMADAPNADSVDGTGDPTATQQPKDVEVSARIEVLRQLSQGGTYAPTTAAIFKFIKDSGVDVKEVAQDICITPASSIATNPGVSDGPTNKLEVELPDGPAKNQGMGKPVDGDFYTSADACLDIGDGFGATKVNVIQIFPAAAEFSASDTDVVAVFFNCLTTLEMSRASPFIDINVVAGFAKNTKTTRLASMGMFLEGPEQSTKDHEAGILNSEDMLLTPDPEKGNRIAFGMESFTSPQTMVGGRYLNRDDNGDLIRYDENASDNLTRPRDPFRPYLSFQKFSAKNPSFAAGPPGTAFQLDANFTLHDATRLRDLGPLITPGLNAGWKWAIRFGWAHPAGSSKYGSVAAGGRFSDADPNRIGELIDAMQIENLYCSINPKISIDSGEAAIDVSLNPMGMNALATPGTADILASRSINLGDWMDNTFKPFQKKLMTAFNAAAKTKFSGVLDSNGIVKYTNRFKRKDAKNHVKIGFFAEVLEAMQNFEEDGDLEAIKAPLNKFLTEITGEKGNGRNKDGSKAEWNNYRCDAIKLLTAAFDEMKKSPDPFFSPAGTKKSASSFPTISKKDDFTYEKLREATLEPYSKAIPDGFPNRGSAVVWVSVGKLMSTFVGAPLGSLPGISEVQLLFYAFNVNASYMWESNLAQMPIPIDPLKSAVLKEYKKQGGMTPLRFIQIVAGFVANPLHSAYGLNNSISWNGNTLAEGTSPVLPEKLQRQKQKKIYRDAYGLEENTMDPEFSPPHLSYFIETLPACDALLQDPDNQPAVNRTICKIHFYDKSSNRSPLFSSLTSSDVGDSLIEITRERSKNTFRTAPLRTSAWDKILANEETFLSDIGLLTGALPDAVKMMKANEEQKEKMMDACKGRYQLNKAHDFGKVKRAMASLFPTLVIGGAASGIISAKYSAGSGKAHEKLTGDYVASMKNDAEINPSTALTMDPIKLKLTTLDLECFGCPYIKPGQQYFIDSGTGTDLDTVWKVVKVTHEIGPGVFTTNVQLSINQPPVMRDMYKDSKDRIADMAAMEGLD